MEVMRYDGDDADEPLDKAGRIPTRALKSQLFLALSVVTRLVAPLRASVASRRRSNLVSDRDS